MIKNICFSIFFIIIFLSNSVYAENNDFRIGSIGVKTPAEYQNDYSVMKVRIDSLNSVCEQTCSWSATGGDAGSFVLDANSDQSLEFNSNAISGQGSVSGTLEISCAEPIWCGAENFDSKSFSHNYPFLGDGLCTIINNYEDCFSASSDCKCSSSKKCKEDLSRSEDSMGCTTYCGNGEVERAYESCSNCPTDVGKCDGMSCNSGGECEGNYCVHGTCWNKAYKEGDGFCDNTKGESCKNSLTDCGCQANERCGATGSCEIYCGNGICEASEEGVCKLDCKWCGDGECNNNEKCGICDLDCGVCENTEVNNELIERATGAVENKIAETRKNQNYVIIGAIALIFMVLIGYGGFKIKNIKSKKKNEKKSKKKKSKVKKSKKK